MNDLMKPDRIVRHSPPGNLDQLEKRTICEVRLEQGKVELYTQTSEDSSNPVWTLLEFLPTKD